MEIISKKDAKANGVKRYFTGAPCPKGHISERMVSNGGCAKCLSDYALKWHHDNRENAITRMAEWRSKNHDRVVEYSRSYKAENRERFLAGCAAWKAANPERVRASQRAWVLANWEKKRIENQNYRALKKLGEGLSVGLVQRLVRLQKGRCACCAEKVVPEKFHVDHIMPLSKGGEHNDKNIQLLCGRCNLQKHAKHPIDFMQSRGFLL